MVCHGVRALEDATLVARLARDRVPLTVCPLSNVKLKVFPQMRAHNLPRLLEAGLVATINSDDPAYFGGYMNQNWRETFAALPLTAAHAVQLAKNSFCAAFVSDSERKVLEDRLSAYVSKELP